MEEKGAVFEEVDEAAYAKLVAERRRKDDFVVDDDGLGYADGGEEDMGGDDDGGGDDGDDSDGSDGEGGTRGRGAPGAWRSAAQHRRRARPGRAACVLGESAAVCSCGQENHDEHHRPNESFVTRCSPCPSSPPAGAASSAAKPRAAAGTKIRTGGQWQLAGALGGSRFGAVGAVDIGGSAATAAGGGECAGAGARRGWQLLWPLSATRASC